MIRAVVIDDEKRARDLLIRKLDQSLSKRLEVVGQADDVSTGVKLIKEQKPDLVFLDIQMHEGTGFDLLEHFPDIDFEVIFVTAYDQYAVKAFKFSAFGYLLKPIKSRELSEVVDKLQERIAQLKAGVDKRLKVLVENYGDDERIKKLVVANRSGFQVTRVEDIVRLEGDSNYTHFIIEGGGKITTSKTLGEYEELLNDHGFFRIHQSTIVNLRHVKGYNRDHGDKVEMSDGKSFNLSRHRKAGFLERFSG